MSCKYLSKALNGKIKCKYYKSYIDYRIDCKNCSNRNLVANKPIRKVSKNRIIVKKEIYQQVYERDKGKCRLCGTSLNLHLHHIDGRGKDLTNDINNCIILCRHCHLEVVHKNQKKYRSILKELIKGVNNE